VSESARLQVAPVAMALLLRSQRQLEATSEQATQPQLVALLVTSEQATQRQLVAQPQLVALLEARLLEARLQVATPQKALLVATPRKALLVATPQKARLVATPQKALLVATQQKALLEVLHLVRVNVLYCICYCKKRVRVVA